MNKLALLISPQARSAYFADYLIVARSEFQQLFGDRELVYRDVGPLEFFELEAEESEQQVLLRLSFVQGLFRIDGDRLQPLAQQADFHLHPDFVFGSKFKGKTNEHLTQLLINVGLAELGIDPTNPSGIKLLDPMCGRATTLLWAMRYGLNSKGLEQDAKALDDIQRNLKKWTKLHRQKHKLSQGTITGQKRKSAGKFLDFSAEQTSLRVISGDARDADQLLKKDKFDLLVCDLPYGVQHFTTDKTRNPLDVIRQCAPVWRHCLKQQSALVLAFNSNNPKRAAMIEAFESQGYRATDFSAAHRMSESIVRDVLILRPS
ncbi:hypothetical protein DV711_00210 [Motiliproteus coralliicola]|uniref:Ribosomal RNA large subunit methyltransferase K/L-like methyltransferase domain-containing protein n=1 Tax=Motiliproteus coralliicola TaxID=2283196 RepID=A0A369WPP8_9GAMM|nr:hypothetical protein [Motiliproteus coralliicola]RDE24068.1 hypothetical protein DV711_00210 [Motiliproteus coralliicola]